MDELRKITGYNNRGHNQQWRQIGTTSATLAIKFYALSPVDGDAVLSVLTARGGDGTATDALTWIDSATKTFYQDVYYPVSGTHIRVTSGKVIIYLREH